MSINNDVRKLESVIANLGPARQNFAHSLINQWDRKRRLSQPQQLWVEKLIEEATKPKPAPEPETVVELGVSFRPLYELFMRARANDIIVPRIKTVVDDKRLELSLASQASKNAGMVYVRYDEDYYGKIDSEGRLTLARTAVVCEEVNQRIAGIGENPSMHGKMHGMKHGNCMFCGRGLRTKDSVYYGYGPICAEKWGLEWGIARERIVEEKQAEVNQFFANAASQFFKRGVT